MYFEGSLEIKLPTVWTDEKAEVGRVREEKRRKKIREEKESSQKTEDAGARKGSQVATHCVCPMVCSSGGSKSRLAKAAGAEPSRDEKLHAVVARGTFEVKMYKAHQSTTCSCHCWTLKRRFVRQAQGILHPAQSEQNLRVL